VWCVCGVCVCGVCVCVFVMCCSFVNMCTCIYCFVLCFVLFHLCIFILFFVCTVVRNIATEGQPNCNITSGPSATTSNININNSNNS